MYNIQYPTLKDCLHLKIFILQPYLKIENSVLIIENLLIEKIFNVQCAIPNIKGLLTPEDSYATAFYLNIESSVLIIENLELDKFSMSNIQCSILSRAIAWIFCTRPFTWILRIQRWLLRINYWSNFQCPIFNTQHQRIAYAWIFLCYSPLLEYWKFVTTQ